MNLQENIRRILREETNPNKMDDWQSKLMVVTSIMDDFYPNFNSKNVFVRDSDDAKLYKDEETNKQYAKVNPSNKKLYFDWDMFHELQKYLGDDLMPYLIIWFNKEFKTDIKTLTAE